MYTSANKGESLREYGRRVNTAETGRGKDGSKVTTVVATPGQGPDRPQEVSYADMKLIGNGSFGVVYQAKLCDTGELIAIKKVLQDKRFKEILIDTLALEVAKRVMSDFYRLKPYGILLIALCWSLGYACAFIR
ncbi:hypothetical protein EVAR_12777_1 [Eumeta japonica]|uniref:Protein kinase domain-containing protein n=1 Tax=Eumeta variegata TaxID=151549 RepID=A0A4C1UBK0_EUMVA|nr:hypothetical protein EVAR_12777_1 [Eumeta japonica]